MTINQLQHIERSLIWTSASLRALIVLFALRRPALLMQCWTFALFCAVTAIWLPFWNPFDVQRLAMADCVLIPLKIAVAAELFYRAMEFVPMIERRAFFALLVVEALRRYWRSSRCFSMNGPRRDFHKMSGRHA